MNLKKLLLLLALSLFLLTSGCIPSTSLKARSDLALHPGTERIILMPVDIELSVLTAGGQLEPNAEWTATACNLVRKAISEKMTSGDIHTITEKDLATVTLDPDEAALQKQLIKLHEMVGRSILVHKYVEPLNLPGKEGKFDWSLGTEAQFLRDKYKADYALFVYLRDSYASGGRVVLMVAAAAFGVGIPGGSQVGFASLVDLRNGEVVWFNRLLRGEGDLRNDADAGRTVEILLTDFPMQG